MNECQYIVAYKIVTESFLQLKTFSVVWQFGTSAFHTVVLWHKLGEVENECTSHNFSFFAIFLSKIIKIGGNLAKFWQIQICTVFLRHGVDKALPERGRWALHCITITCCGLDCGDVLLCRCFYPQRRTLASLCVFEPLRITSSLGFSGL